MSNIIIIDYGMGNLGSIVNMLKRVGVAAKVSADPRDVASADKLILPGDGAFDTGMKYLADLQLLDVLNDKVLNQQTPTLGVCLGMQLLMERSEEGTWPGLGWIDGEAIRFRFNEQQTHLKIPHMGWNTVMPKREGVLLKGMDDASRFYFVHSYHVLCANPDDVLGTTEHGYEFPSVLQRGNIMGAQFHPEKSHKFGLRMLRNFVECV